MKQNIFVEYNEIKGTNKDTKEPYRFANITLSNGLVSTEYGMDLELIETVKNWKMGQRCEVEKTEKARGRLFDVRVVGIKAVN